MLEERLDDALSVLRTHAEGAALGPALGLTPGGTHSNGLLVGALPGHPFSPGMPTMEPHGVSTGLHAINLQHMFSGCLPQSTLMSSPKYPHLFTGIPLSVPIWVPLWVPQGTVMDFPGFPYGYPGVPLRVPYGFPKL